MASLEPAHATRTRRRIAAEVVALAASCAGALVAWHGRLAGADVAWLAMWAVVAGGGWALTAPDGIDRPGRRSVAPGPQATAEELRRERRGGWQTLERVAVDRARVEQVAFGPGGVLAIESVVLDLAWEPGDAELDGLLRQPVARCAAAGAGTAAAVRERSRLRLEVRPVLVVWGSAASRLDAPLRTDGVTIVPGHLLRAFLRSLPDRVGELDQRCARLAVQQFAGMPDDGQQLVAAQPLLTR